MRLLPLMLALALGLLSFPLAPADSLPFVVNNPLPGGEPRNVAADFADDGESLVITWEAPDGDEPSAYRIYRDGSAIEDVTSTSYTADLSAWTGAARNYQIRALYDTTEGAVSAPIVVSQVPPKPGDPPCPILGVGVGWEYPYVRYYIRSECLPP